MEALDVSDFVQFDPARPTHKVLIDVLPARFVLFCLESGQRVLTKGSESEVTFYTVRGEGTAIIGEEEIALRPGVLVRCPPQVQHGLRGLDSLVVLAVVAPRPW